MLILLLLLRCCSHTPCSTSHQCPLEARCSRHCTSNQLNACFKSNASQQGPVRSLNPHAPGASQVHELYACSLQGQGLHTKCAMVAAQELRIPLSSVYIADTATNKVPNSSSTAASASSDLYCAAVIDACRQLSQRLAPFREASKGGEETPFKEAVKQAYMQRVDLCAHGFHATPLITGARVGALHGCLIAQTRPLLGAE